FRRVLFRSWPVDRLSARPGADEGDVQLGYFETQEQEREFVASHMKKIYERSQQVEIDDTGRATKKSLSAAILVRTNRHAAEIGRHLQAHGVPYEILGLGGLLWAP